MVLLFLFLFFFGYGTMKNTIVLYIYIYDTMVIACLFIFYFFRKSLMKLILYLFRHCILVNTSFFWTSITILIWIMYHVPCLFIYIFFGGGYPWSFLFFFKTVKNNIHLDIESW